jgi:hypothetical protein
MSFSDCLRPGSSSPGSTHPFLKHYLPASQIELNIIHQSSHEKHAGAMGQVDVGRGRWIRQAGKVETASLIGNGNQQLPSSSTASANDHSLCWVFPVAVNNGIRQGFQEGQAQTRNVPLDTRESLNDGHDFACLLAQHISALSTVASKLSARHGRRYKVRGWNSSYCEVLIMDWPR